MSWELHEKKVPLLILLIFIIVPNFLLWMKWAARFTHITLDWKMRTTNTRSDRPSGCCCTLCVAKTFCDTFSPSTRLSFLSESNLNSEKTTYIMFFRAALGSTFLYQAMFFVCLRSIWFLWKAESHEKTISILIPYRCCIHSRALISRERVERRHLILLSLCLWLSAFGHGRISKASACVCVWAEL